MGLPYSFSVATACVLMEIFTALLVKPKQKRTAINCKVVCVNPKPNNAAAYKGKAKRSSFRLPMRVMTQPENGSESIKPTGSVNKMPPKAASDKFNFCWMPAIREAQLAKVKPARKNTKPTVARNTFLGIWTAVAFDTVWQRYP